MRNQFAATVVSLFPLEINEPKPGLYPGYFHIPAAPLGGLSYLVVGDAIFFTENKNEQILTVKTPFHVLADSIVHDFIENHIGRVVGEAEPGLFWVPGEYESEEDIRSEHALKIAKHESMQNRWFSELITIADDTYNRTRRHTSVSRLQRLAAERLNVQRPWLISSDSSDKCPFCKSALPFGAVKCPNCREIVNPEQYAKLVKEYGETVQ